MVSTLIGLHFGMVESNPLLAIWGANAFFGFKVLFPTTIIILCLLIGEEAEKQKNKKLIFGVRLALGISILGWLVIVINNLIVLSHII